MLANLASRRLDELVSEIAERHQMTYTRYADDLTLSTRDRAFTRTRCRAVIREIYGAMRQLGFAPNITKTQILPPGARKVVLGLLVSGTAPRLTRSFRSMLRQHIYYLTRTDDGASRHAAARGFKTIAGLRNHLSGLVNFAKQIEPDYGSECERALVDVDWPV